MKKEYLGIQIDLSRDELFDKLGIARLQESYMRDDETSPQERFAYVSQKFSSNPEHAQRLYDYASKHWLSYSTPILACGRMQKIRPVRLGIQHLCLTILSNWVRPMTVMLLYGIHKSCPMGDCCTSSHHGLAVLVRTISG